MLMIIGERRWLLPPSTWSTSHAHDHTHNMSTHVDKYDDLLKEYLEVKEDEIYGRGVYCRTDIGSGVEVIKSAPIIHVISNKERGRVCDWCTNRLLLLW